MVIWETPEGNKVPFLLKFNVNTQLRYLNTMSSPDTFTDHLGNVREVHVRNDITVNRAMFILGGYVFDPRLRYSFTVWTSAGAESIVVAASGAISAGMEPRPLVLAAVLLAVAGIALAGAVASVPLWIF